MLVGPYGNVIGQDGNVLADLGGGGGPDGRFYVCGFGAGMAGLIGFAPWLLVGASVALAAVLVLVPRALARRDRVTRGGD